MANANADHNVSNSESQATRFEINRMLTTHDAFYRMYTETRSECNERILRCQRSTSARLARTQINHRTTGLWVNR
jgi:hypothetical protein